MATLVLSTVGTMLGGPVGGLLGTLAGQAIDQQLFGGGPRQGPRLGDLSVQTSAYGTAIPRVYGTMRVAGTVVWATELKEESELQGDGKSQPETVVYTYSASFAVALSSRPARRVKRIWADGKLLRGAAGDFKVSTKFRFYPGSEGQSVDPLIAAHEGTEETPAYRGLALAVFEDLQLAEFGNRIPSLTFELEGDDQAPELAEVLRDASRGTIDCDDQRAIAGYAAHGADVRAAVLPLVEAYAVELQDDGDVLRGPSTGQIRTPAEQELGAALEGEAVPRFQRTQLAAAQLPSSLTLTYYEPSRDYQAGQARAAIPSPSRVSRQLTLPCVLPAADAKLLAESLLARSWAERDQLQVRLAPSHLGLKAGSRMRIPNVAGEWRVESVSVERLTTVAGLRPVSRGASAVLADPGRPRTEIDVVSAPLRLALFDLPDLGVGDASTPTLHLAAASPSSTWRPAPLEIALGGALTGSQTAPTETILGSAPDPLPDGQPFTLDLGSSVDVVLVNPQHWLQSRDDDALADGANLAVIGDELIQFGDAEPIATGRFRLSRLLRGRRGTEWAMQDHAAGESFALLDWRSLKPVVAPLDMLGAELSATAYGPANASSPPSVSRIISGEAVRPLSPARLAAGWTSDGSLGISWVRRSKQGWAWVDEIDVPPDPALRGYRVNLAGPNASLELDVAEQNLTISAGDLAALGEGGLTIAVRQVGALALSRPATLLIDTL